MYDAYIWQEVYSYVNVHVLVAFLLRHAAVNVLLGLRDIYGHEGNKSKQKR